MSRDRKGHREPKSAIAARRSFLKAVGAAAAMLPFYKMLEDNVALAQSGQLPLKFVGMSTFHGTTQKFYARQPGETDTNFDISYPDCCLRPFDQADKYGYSFRDKILIFEGFDYGVGRFGPYNYSADLVADIDIPMHGAMGFLLTGSATTDDYFNQSMSHQLQNASLDHYLAGLYGGETPFRSIELKTENTEHISALNIAAGEGGTFLTTMTSPEQIWDKFFAGLVMSDDPAALAAAAQKRAVGKSVLDFAIGDLQRLQARLANAERQKLDQHLTVMRDLEKQFEATTMSGCTVPPRRAETGNPDPADDYIVGNSNNAGIVDLDRVTDMQIELLAQILICDLTRFGTIVLPNFAGPITGGTLIPNLAGTGMVTASTVTDIPIPADFHLEIAHVTDNGDINAVGIETHRAVASMQRYYHGKVARLMQRLQDAGVLDSTLILMGNEGGGGYHTLRNVPLVMCGGANGAIQMGRRIVSPGRTARAGDYPVQANGQKTVSTLTEPSSHNPILVAIANAFHTAAGEPEIDSYGTCPKNPDFTMGVQGLI